MKKNKKLFYERARELPSRMRVARGATGVTVRDYAYDSVGRVLSRKTARLGRTVSDSFGYNTRSELVSAVLGTSDYAYDFDSIGNRLSSSEAGTALAYSANALNQYVSVGERSGRSDTLVASSLSSPISSDAGTTENAFSPSYDVDGNTTLLQTSTGTWSVSYNAENRPVRFENTETGTIVECAYDFKGRRFEKKVTREGAVALHLRYVYDGYLQIAALDLTRSNAPALWLVLWDPSQPTATRPLALQRYVYVGYTCVQVLDGDDGNAVVKEFAWDPTEPVATKPLFMFLAQSRLSLLYTHDGNKNVSDACYLAPQNGVGAHYEYAPFGALTRVSKNTRVTVPDVISANPFRFSSEYFDDELGLVYYNFRHYSPTLGRWLSRDSAEEAGGLNLYAFIENETPNDYDDLGNGKGKSKRPQPAPVYPGGVGKPVNPVPNQEQFNNLCENVLTVIDGGFIGELSAATPIFDLMKAINEAYYSCWLLKQRKIGLGLIDFTSKGCCQIQIQVRYEFPSGYSRSFCDWLCGRPATHHPACGSIVDVGLAIGTYVNTPCEAGTGYITNILLPGLLPDYEYIHLTRPLAL